MDVYTQIDQFINSLHPFWMQRFCWLITNKVSAENDLDLCPHCGNQTLPSISSEALANSCTVCTESEEYAFGQQLADMNCLDPYVTKVDSINKIINIVWKYKMYNYASFNSQILWAYFYCGFSCFSEEAIKSELERLQNDALSGKVFALIALEMYGRLFKE